VELVYHYDAVRPGIEYMYFDRHPVGSINGFCADPFQHEPGRGPGRLDRILPIGVYRFFCEPGKARGVEAGRR
jgi:hypothetical protein